MTNRRDFLKGAAAAAVGGKAALADGGPVKAPSGDRPTGELKFGDPYTAFTPEDGQSLKLRAGGARPAFQFREDTDCGIGPLDSAGEGFRIVTIPK